MVKVLDASALLVYLAKEPAYDKVKDLFVKAAGSERKLLMTALNMGEVYYILAKDHGSEEAGKVYQFVIETFPIEFVPADLSLTQQAVLYKINYKLPFVDSFTAALAKLRKAELVTADKDFKALEGEIKIVWV